MDPITWMKLHRIRHDERFPRVCAECLEPLGEGPAYEVDGTTDRCCGRCVAEVLETAIPLLTTNELIARLRDEPPDIDRQMWGK